MRRIAFYCVAFSSFAISHLSLAETADKQVEQLFHEAYQVSQLNKTSQLNGQGGQRGWCQIYRDKLDINFLAGRIGGDYYKADDATTEEKQTFRALVLTSLAQASANHVESSHLSGRSLSTKPGTKIPGTFVSVDLAGVDGKLKLFLRKNGGKLLLVNLQIEGIAWISLTRGQLKPVGLVGGLSHINSVWGALQRRSSLGTCS